MEREGKPVSKKHANIQKNLLALVQLFPQLLENRNDMIRRYWSVYDKATTGDEIAKATSAESITRNLRRLVQAGLVTLPRHKKLTQMAREYTHEFHALN